MQFPRLLSGKFIRRYKRFLVDIELDNGEVLTVHCPNTGAMTGCLSAGATAYYSASNNPMRKYPHTLEWLALADGARACINTQRPNQLIKEAIENSVIGELDGYKLIRSEQKYGNEGSRIDLLLSNHEFGRADCYVEVKNVTLCDRNTGYFPDAVSLRALKHVRELMTVVEQGNRAVLVFCINHSQIESLKPADKIHLDYGQLLRDADEAGVELLAYKSEISTDAIRTVRRIPIDLATE